MFDSLKNKFKDVFKKDQDEFYDDDEFWADDANFSDDESADGEFSDDDYPTDDEFTDDEYLSEDEVSADVAEPRKAKDKKFSIKERLRLGKAPVPADDITEPDVTDKEHEVAETPAEPVKRFSLKEKLGLSKQERPSEDDGPAESPAEIKHEDTAGERKLSIKERLGLSRTDREVSKEKEDPVCAETITEPVAEEPPVTTAKPDVSEKKLSVKEKLKLARSAPKDTGKVSQRSETVKKRGTKNLEDILWNLEIALMEADVALPVAEEIKNHIRNDVSGRKIDTREHSLYEFTEMSFKNSISEILKVNSFDFDEWAEKRERPAVIMFVGINGTGKTTSIAKIANRLIKDGKTVVLAAADTFRAGAIEQITIHS